MEVRYPFVLAAWLDHTLLGQLGVQEISRNVK
jgi:hypothetical protein